MKKRCLYLFSLVIISVLLFCALYSLERKAPYIEAINGELDLESRNLGEQMYLLRGWVADGEDTYRITLCIKAYGENVYLYLPLNADTLLTVDGKDAELWDIGSYSIFEIPGSQRMETHELRLQKKSGGMISGANLCLFVGPLPILLKSMNTTAFLRVFIMGGNFTAFLYSLSLWFRKRSERYLLPFALYSGITLLRVSRRTFASLAKIVYLSVFSAFPFWQADSALGTHALNLIWSIFLDFGLRYFILRAFLPVRIRRFDYMAYCAIGCAICMGIASFCSNEGVLTWMPYFLRIACFIAELWILVRAYLGENHKDTPVLLFTWSCMFSIWVFNRACEVNIIPTYSVGSRVGLGGIQETAMLLGFLYTINARFAGKFAEADTLFQKLERVNAGLEEAICEKTRELQDSCVALQESQQQKDEFLSNMAHNVKTPLFSLSGYTEMAGAVLRQDPDQALSYLDIVRKNAGRIQSTVKNLLLASRLENKKIHFNPTHIDMGLLLAQVIEAAQPKAEEKRVAITLSCCGRLYCKGDETFMLQALENLLDNALESCREDGRIQVMLKRKGMLLLVEIHDDGCGIEEQVLPHIFERYYSHHADHNYGSGLGLSISQDIVEQNGGCIYARSEWGKGSVFTIELPISQEEEEEYK